MCLDIVCSALWCLLDSVFGRSLIKINQIYRWRSLVFCMFSYLSSAGGRPPAGLPPARPAPCPAGCWVVSAGRTGPVPGSCGSPCRLVLGGCSAAPGSSASGSGPPRSCSGHHEILESEPALRGPALPQERGR